MVLLQVPPDTPTDPNARAVNLTIRIINDMVSENVFVDVTVDRRNGSLSQIDYLTAGDLLGDFQIETDLETFDTVWVYRTTIPAEYYGGTISITVGGAEVDFGDGISYVIGNKYDADGTEHQNINFTDSYIYGDISIKAYNYIPL